MQSEQNLFENRYKANLSAMIILTYSNLSSMFISEKPERLNLKNLFRLRATALKSSFFLYNVFGKDNLMQKSMDPVLNWRYQIENR